MTSIGKIIGMEKLKRKLARIPDAVKARAQSDLTLAGREVNMQQRSFVPVDDGTLRGSIRTEPLTDGTIGVSIVAGGPSTRKVVRKSAKGNAPSYDYALAVEYGTKNMAPKAFFWPGYKLGKKKAMRRARFGIRRALRQVMSNG
ncbi:HK97 gp10 family phage protein [Brucella sp. HL-2]|nr:HK97-gp10 family putative phage morphogenesis protein [Brucella sp. HL-2]MCV9907053.1 HK97 gp10 family phage protein [Brucella sp. HL-2]